MHVHARPGIAFTADALSVVLCSLVGSAALADSASDGTLAGRTSSAALAERISGGALAACTSGVAPAG